MRMFHLVVGGPGVNSRGVTGSRNSSRGILKSLPPPQLHAQQLEHQSQAQQWLPGYGSKSIGSTSSTLLRGGQAALEGSQSMSSLPTALDHADTAAAASTAATTAADSVGGFDAASDRGGSVHTLPAVTAALSP